MCSLCKTVSLVQMISFSFLDFFNVQKMEKIEETHFPYSLSQKKLNTAPSDHINADMRISSCSFFSKFCFNKMFCTFLILNYNYVIVPFLLIFIHIHFVYQDYGIHTNIHYLYCICKVFSSYYFIISICICIHRKILHKRYEA